ncbi:hypothetical protein UFOVP27_46 [uncultured Caudovirales phage]|uniref:Uncharacterized protein n=1 Tax=uncultured Caudovirales phage TaxID=2100421 RepID=A0A6J5KIT9_9CAUD|nr:hypothetical protein UFOVP27_46 [uncultured Caudovirales phage]
MGVKINLTNPVTMGISGSAGMTTWAAMGYPTDPKHLMAVASTVLAGSAVPTTNTAKPNVSADSHVITPYVNNLEVSE